ncbi:MAG: hypothetical protein E6Q97_16115 [Desulfurellales bacterium]|nr:MAG: hypothetical protein E6Q97_16115 [Desulfurellales bacterium]
MTTPQTKPLDRLTIAQLLDLYGRTVWALSHDTQSAQLLSDKVSIESEARRRDQAAWLPASKKVNREPDGDVIFA